MKYIILFLILFFIFFIFSIIYIIHESKKDNIDITKYATNLNLYNIIKKHKSNYLLIEPSIKYIQNSNLIKKNRYTIPIFDVKYNSKLINNIINDLIKYKFINKNNLIEINKLIQLAKQKNADLIFGVDDNIFKLYVDLGINANNANKFNLKCIIIDSASDYKFKFKYYKIYKSKYNFNNINKLLHQFKLSEELINHIYIAGNDFNNISNWNEFHFILKKPINNIYVIGYKPNELTFYYR